MQHSESALQKAICALHIAAVVNPLAAILFAVPNGEKRAGKTIGALSGIASANRALLPEAEAILPYGQGLLPGVADLVLLTPGRVDFIELKAANLTTGRGGVLSTHQKRFRKAVEALGHAFWVVTAQEGYLAVLEQRGVDLRLSSAGLRGH